MISNIKNKLNILKNKINHLLFNFSEKHLTFKKFVIFTIIFYVIYIIKNPSVLNASEIYQSISLLFSLVITCSLSILLLDLPNIPTNSPNYKISYLLTFYIVVIPAIIWMSYTYAYLWYQINYIYPAILTILYVLLVLIKFGPKFHSSLKYKEKNIDNNFLLSVWNFYLHGEDAVNSSLHKSNTSSITPNEIDTVRTNLKQNLTDIDDIIKLRYYINTHKFSTAGDILIQKSFSILSVIIGGGILSNVNFKFILLLIFLLIPIYFIYSKFSYRQKHSQIESILPTLLDDLIEEKKEQNLQNIHNTQN